MNLASAVTRDYLTDARIGKLPFMKLKKFLSDNGVDAKEMSSPAGSAVALDFAFRTTEAPLDAMGAALQKAGALEAEGKMTEAAEVMAGAMEAAAASIQARHRGKLTRQATSQKLAEARMSGVKQ